MDASKIMWLLYEHPEIAFSDVREKIFDIRKRAFKIPPLGKKADWCASRPPPAPVPRSPRSP